MSFLKRIVAQIKFQKDGTSINVEDVYLLNPQYKSLVENVALHLQHYAQKFNVRDPHQMLDIFVAQVKDEMP